MDYKVCHEYDQGYFSLYDHYYDHDLNNDYDNGFDLDHLQDIYTSKGFDRDEGYDFDGNFDDNHDCHIDLMGPLGSGHCHL